MTESPESPVKRRRGRPPISSAPGVRYMIHLPQEIADNLKAAGDGSISRGVIRQATGTPSVAAPKRTKARKRARAKAASHE
jgi:hypothetical protein